MKPREARQLLKEYDKKIKELRNIIDKEEITVTLPRITWYRIIQRLECGSPEFKDYAGTIAYLCEQDIKRQDNEAGYSFT